MMQLLIEGQNNIIETFENNTEILKRLAQHLINKNRINMIQMFSL